MPINKSDIIFIGNAGGICGYLCHSFNIIRKSSSLTTKRVAEEPEFEGFRNSGNRMKQASPIAASLYQLLEKEQKVYALYRTLTGETLKLIKQGMDKEAILIILKEKYIDPILEQALHSKNQSRKILTNSDKSNKANKPLPLGGDLLKTIPYSREKKLPVRAKRIIQNTERGSNQIIHIEEEESKENAVKVHEPANIETQPLALTPKQKRVTQFSAYIYMGRLKECKGLKMWLRPCI